MATSSFLKRSFVILIILSLVLFIILIFVRFNVKKEIVKDPSDVTASAYLCYYGMGLVSANNILGEVKVKLFTLHPSGGLANEYYYDRNGKINKVIVYHENGKIACTAALDGFGGYGVIVDGIVSQYDENGQMEVKEGKRVVGNMVPGGPGLVLSHGICQYFSPDGTISSTKYYINDKECTIQEWKEWLKAHPEDVKYDH